MKSTSTSYQTTGEALEVLTKRGFNASFFIKNGQLHSYTTGNEYRPEQATVVQTLRVEGESDPAAMVAIYALQVEDAAEGDENGVLVQPFGPSADQAESEVVDRLKIRHHGSGTQQH